MFVTKRLRQYLIVSVNGIIQRIILNGNFSENYEHTQNCKSDVTPRPDSRAQTAIKL